MEFFKKYNYLLYIPLSLFYFFRAGMKPGDQTVYLLLGAAYFIIAAVMYFTKKRN